jgi:hypothetical protein
MKIASSAPLRALISGRRGFLAVGVIALVFIAAITRYGTGSQPAVMDVTDAVPAAADTEAAEAVEPGLDAVPVLEATDAGAAAQLFDPGSLLDFPRIADGVPRVRKPEAVRGIYLNAWAAGSPRKLQRLIELAAATEVNTFVIDVKEGGQVSYRSQVPLARSIGADQDYIRDVRGVLRQLREHGIYPIARIVVFRDEVLAQARPDWSVQHREGGEWIDSYGHRWVDSFNRSVWDYNIAIAREALELGFSEVQWDYVRFPDVPSSLMRVAHWPARDGRTMAKGIREFLLYSREQLREYDVPVTADVFGLTVSVRNDMGIGQLWEEMIDATDVLLPMVYPSHFARGSYGIAIPNAAPYEVVRTAMEHAVRRSAGVQGAAAIRPWLQDFTLGAPRYDAAHVRAQIDAVYAAGLSEWVLWNPGSNYTAAALADAEGRAPVLRQPGPADAVSPPPAPRRPAPLGTPVGAGG